MDQVVPEIDRIAAYLIEEIEQCHIQIGTMHGYAVHNGYSTNLECSKMMARLMQSQVHAMMAMKRLRSDGTQHTCTVVHRWDIPTPKKSKTNAPESAQ